LGMLRFEPSLAKSVFTKYNIKIGRSKVQFGKIKIGTT